MLEEKPNPNKENPRMFGKHKGPKQPKKEIPKRIKRKKKQMTK